MGTDRTGQRTTDKKSLGLKNHDSSALNFRSIGFGNDRERQGIGVYVTV